MLVDRCEIPGPIDWETASHWIVYDHDNFTVETWCKMGPDYKFKLMTCIRPMVESEIIGSKLRGHSRDAVLKAFGVIEYTPVTPIKKRGLLSRILGYRSLRKRILP